MPCVAAEGVRVIRLQYVRFLFWLLGAIARHANEQHEKLFRGLFRRCMTRVVDRHERAKVEADAVLDRARSGVLR